MKITRTFWTAALLAVSCVEGGPAAGQVGFSLQVGPPTPEFIATTSPVYFEGHPTYWYNGYWHWRDPRGQWQFYRQEPPALASRRVQRPPRRVFYENQRPWGRPVASPPSRVVR
jgi:hypothetical protein